MRNNLPARFASLAALVIAAPLGAQSLAANGVSAAAENAANRAPIFTGAAMVAPAKKMGFGVQALAARESMDDAYTFSGTQTQLSGFYGVTNRITVGAYVPFINASSEITTPAGTVDGSESGMGDAGVFGRIAAWQSQNGATRLGFGAELTFATGDSVFTNDEMAYQIDAAVSHRVGRWNLHAVPGVATANGQDMIMNLNLAGVFAVSERMGVSAELLNQFGGAQSDVDGAEGMQDIDLGTGLRYRFAGRTSMDFGLRYNIAQNIADGAEKPSRVGAVFGLNMTF